MCHDTDTFSTPSRVSCRKWLFFFKPTAFQLLPRAHIVGKCAKILLWALQNQGKGLWKAISKILLRENAGWVSLSSLRAKVDEPSSLFCSARTKGLPRRETRWSEVSPPDQKATATRTEQKRTALAWLLVLAVRGNDGKGRRGEKGGLIGGCSVVEGTEQGKVS